MQNGNEHNIKNNPKKIKQAQHIKVAQKKPSSEEGRKPLGFIHCWSPR